MLALSFYSLLALLEGLLQSSSPAALAGSRLLAGNVNVVKGPNSGPIGSLLSSLKNINPGGLAVIRPLSGRYPAASKSWRFVSTVCKFLPKAARPPVSTVCNF